MGLPKRSASSSSRRCIVFADTGPDAGRTSPGGAAQAPRTIPQPRAAAPRTFFTKVIGRLVLARAYATKVGRRVVAGGALDGLVDDLFLVAQAHRDVAARLQVVVDFEGAEEHRHVVPVLVVEFRHAPQLAAAVVLVDREDGPAVLVDVERAARVDVAGGRLPRRIDQPHAVQLVTRQSLVHVARLQ